MSNGMGSGFDVINASEHAPRGKLTLDQMSSAGRRGCNIRRRQGASDRRRRVAVTLVSIPSLEGEA